MNIDSRKIGSIKGDPNGPVAVFIGGIHGNEPAGVLALQRVLGKIIEEDVPINGTIHCLIGNLAAIRQEVRYIDKDLNRIWFTRLNENHESIEGTAEISERDELARTFHEIILATETPLYFFDLHTTSSQSVPFISISDTLRNRKLVEDVKTPVVLGLEERMEGTLFSYFSEMGVPMVLYEGGQHEEVSSIDNIESFIWMMLKKVGVVKKKHVKDFKRYEGRIARENVFDHNVFELTYRYDLKGKEGYRTKRGYVNFQKVRKGEKIGTHSEGDVRIPFKSRIFMPLYQSKGSDGFFLIRSIRPVWLKISERVRRLGLDKYVSLFPGIKKHPKFKNAFVISPYVARSFVLNIFHLLGYRRVIRFDEKFIVSRRPYDWHAPKPETIRKNFDQLIKPLTGEVSV